MRIEKKIWPEWFKLVKSGKKTYEIRIADFDLSEGDTLVMKEWDPKTQKYLGREIEKKVGFFYHMQFDEVKMKFFNVSDDALLEHGLYIISLVD